MGILSNKIIVSQLAVRQTTSPSEEPITLAEQKLYSRIDGTDEDTLIPILIKASTKKCEDYIGGGFITRTYEQIEDAGENQNNWIINRFVIGNEFAIEIKNIQISSIEKVSFYDINNNETVISSSLYRLDRPTNIQPARVVFDLDAIITPNTRYFTQYKIDYTAGYSDASSVPDDIKLAIMQTCQGYYENRETMQNLPPVAKNLLMSYRIIEL